jgi:flavin reductase (DIM6/NTAB) family NADH-FMN oxidoreductase RutF
MTKKVITDIKGEVKNLLYPYPVVLVGANVNGKPNYANIGLVGWICYDAMSVSVYKEHHTNLGIRQNKTFSVNQPSVKLLRQVHYCGSYSGKEKDKVSLFTNFYGSLKTAPMIEECPVNIECRLIQTIERSIHTVFIGEVVAIHLTEDYVNQEYPDITKINPLFYAPSFDDEKVEGGYWQLGQFLGKGSDIAKGFKELE